MLLKLMQQYNQMYHGYLDITGRVAAKTTLVE